MCPSQRGRHQRWGGQCGEEQLDLTGVEGRYGRMEVGARFWPAEGLGGHQLERRCEVTPPGSPARSCWDWREDQDTVLRVNAVVRWANQRDEDTAEASAARLRRVQSGASCSVTAGSTHAAAAPPSNAFTVNLLLGAAQSTRRCSRVTPPSGRFLQRGPTRRTLRMDALAGLQTRQQLRYNGLHRLAVDSKRCWWWCVEWSVWCRAKRVKEAVYLIVSYPIPVFVL